jgi:DNA-binding Lrp family transcriptional regulator
MLTVYVLVNTGIGSTVDVAENLRRLNGIDEAHVLDAMFDIVAKMRAENSDKVKEISGKISKIENVVGTISMIVDEK